MSTENTAVALATDSGVSSQPVAPPVGAGGTPESTPAPVDTTASEAKPEGETPEKQSRRDSRAFATLRRENRELYRRLGAMEERLASGQQQPQAEGEQPTQRVQEGPRVSDADREASQGILDRLEEAGQDIDGFDEVMEAITDPRFPISRTMRDFLGESDRSAHLAQWLTKNRGEAARISRLEPAVAVRALEKAEARLTAAKPTPAKKVTGAQPPVSTVGGSSTATFDPNKADMDDFAKWRRRQA